MPADPMQELIEAVESVPPYARLDLTGSKKAAFVALTLGEWEQVKAALLSRAEQAQGVEGGWLPIETPPPRSLPTLVSRPAYSADQFGPVAAFVDVAGVWRVWLSEGGDSPVPFEPTHWRPLPPPPGSAATPKSAAGEGSNPDPKGAL